jgi:hypothetical protein
MRVRLPGAVQALALLGTFNAPPVRPSHSKANRLFIPVLSVLNLQGALIDRLARGTS